MPTENTSRVELLQLIWIAGPLIGSFVKISVLRGLERHHFLKLINTDGEKWDAIGRKEIPSVCVKCVEGVNRIPCCAPTHAATLQTIIWKRWWCLFSPVHASSSEVKIHSASTVQA